MNADSSGLDDPELASKRPRLEHSEKLAQASQEGVRACVRRQFEYYQSTRFARWEPQDVAEIVVQRDEDPPLRLTAPEDRVVRLPAQLFFADSRDIVAGRGEELLPPRADILVELELHPARFSVGTEMNRSRAASAP